MTRSSVKDFSKEISSLKDLLRYRMLRQPEKTAYVFLKDGESEEGRLTYNELDRRARAIAVRLQSMAAFGERALLIYPPGLDFIAAFFGCLYAGIVAVPAYPPHPARPERTFPRLKSIARNARPFVALTTSPILDMAAPLMAKDPDFGKMQILATDVLGGDHADEWREPAVNGDTTAFLQYTSGSTGTPKGVIVSHGNLLHNSECIRQAFGVTPADISVTWLPSFHDMGLIDGVLQPIYTGFKGILMAPAAFLQRPFRWLRAISHYRATHSGGPNFAYELCIRKISEEQRRELDLSCWTGAYNGAEPIRRETLERFTRTFAPCGFRANSFYPCYGLAEATLIVSGGRREDLPVYREVEADELEKDRVVAVSRDSGQKALDMIGVGAWRLGTEVVIANPKTLGRCAADEVGEIWVSGPSMAQGYWQNPEATEETFRAYLSDTGEGPFIRTGDLGFVDNGELFITGRLKDVIIIRGRNHYPQDIEKTAEQSHPGLRPGCSAAFSTEVNGEEQLVVLAELERRYMRRCQKASEEAAQRWAERRQITEYPDFSTDQDGPPDAEAVIEAIRKAVAERHELQVHAVVLLKVGTILKTSSGKIQRRACRTKFLDGTLNAVVGSILEASEMPGPEDAPDMTRLMTLPPEERQALMASYLRSLIASVAKMPATQLRSEQFLSSLGLDSLMAIELQHRLEEDLGVVWSMTRFLEDLTIDQLAAEALEKSGAGKPEPDHSVSDVASDPSSLSYNQKSLWFMNQLAPESAAYNVFFAVTIRSEVNIPALQQAFQTLVSRHPVLRTTYAVRDGEPVRQICNDAAFLFEAADASGWSPDETERRLTEEAHRPFDLENGPVFRAHLFTRSAAEHILLLNTHHIATDLWSLSILLDELGILYSAEKDDDGKGLPPLETAYTDYVRWQAHMLAGPEGERLRAYWQKKLGGELPVLNLPTDHPRPPVQTYAGATYGFRLDRELTRNLKSLARSSNATLYMTLLTAFNVLLYRYTGQEDIPVGSPIAGRSRAEFEGVQGYFVNPVVMRSDLSGNPSFSDLLSKVRRTVLEALNHQDYPFQLLVEQLQPERDPSRSPLFQVVFGLEKPHRAEASAPFIMNESGFQMNLGKLALESLALKHRIAQFDMMLLMAETDGELVASLEYNTDLFESDTVKRMVGHFQTLITGISANPDRAVSDLPLLSESEQHRLLVEWNDTVAAYPRAKCLHELFEEQAARTPDAVAVVFKESGLTFRELNRHANQLAHYLRKLNVGPESLVGICMERSVDMVVAVLGILKSGGAYVPLNPAHRQERLKYMLEGIEVLLTQKKLAAELPEQPPHVICLDTDWASLISEENDESSADMHMSPENLAYVIYTSGSAGSPKGVAIRHHSVLNLLAGLHQAISVYQSEAQLRVSLNGPLAFDTSVKQLFQLLNGHTVEIIPESLQLDSSALLSYLHRRQVDVFDCTPSQLTQMLSEDAATIDSEPFPRVILVGGEPIDNIVWTRLKEMKNQVCYNVYGPTECTVDATICDLRTAPATPSIGRPIANTRVYILDSNLRPVPIGVPGELHIGGAGLARGYLNDAEMTKEKFIPDPFDGGPDARLYKTGDKGRYLSDGHIEFLGRIDDQVKIRGFRIEPGEIKAVLKKHPDIQEAEVIVREDVPGDRRIVAYVVPKPERSQMIEEHQRYKLPNNLAVVHLNQNETDFLYKEMFEVYAYLKHGITLNDGDCIFDVGANIGLFTLFAHLSKKNVKIYGFEPNPFVFDLLRLNTVLYNVDATLFDCGLSDKKQVADFTFYPGFSILSGVYADRNEEKAVVRSFIRKQQDAEIVYEEEISDDSVEQLLTEKFRSKTLDVRLMPLSDIIEANKISQIDLLKINVEKSEFDVLAGIREKDWSKIRQISVEVHDIDGRLDRIKELLEAKGFQVKTERDWSLEVTSGTNYYVYATRKSEAASPSYGSDSLHSLSLAELPFPFLTAGDLRDFLDRKLPDYMVPSAFVMLEKMPLTPNGKVDRNALPAPDRNRSALEADYMPPRNELEQAIAAIWQAVLRLENPGIHDNFFDLGGHSLLVMQVHARLRKHLGRDISVVDLFRYPTISTLAQYLGGKAEEKENAALDQVRSRADKRRAALKRRPKGRN